MNVGCAVSRSRPVSRLDSFPLWIHWRWRFGSTSWPPTSWSVSLSLSWPASPLTSGTTRIRATATATWSRISSPSPTVSGSLQEPFSVKDRDSIQRSLLTPTRNSTEKHFIYFFEPLEPQIFLPVHPPQALTNPLKNMSAPIHTQTQHKKNKSYAIASTPKKNRTKNNFKNVRNVSKAAPKIFSLKTAGVPRQLSALERSASVLIFIFVWSKIVF